MRTFRTLIADIGVNILGYSACAALIGLGFLFVWALTHGWL